MPAFELRLAGSICRAVPDTPNVTKLGWVEDLGTVFARAPLSVNPMQAGTGINIKLLESMAAGVPTVSTATGARGLPESALAGVFVVPDDDAQAFAEAVVRFASDAALRRQAGLAARDEASRLERAATGATASLPGRQLKTMFGQYLQLWSHLAPLHRAGALALTVGNIAGSVLEVMGLALFGAVLLGLTGGAAATVGPWSGGLPGLVGGASLSALTVACGIVYLVKNALLLLLAWLEARLAFGVQSHLTVHALGAMLRQDYEDASRGNQSSRINLLTSGMYALAFNVLLPGLTMVAEVILMLALVLFLVLTQPLFVSGMLATLCAVAASLVLVSRRVVLRLGNARHRSEDDKLQLLSGIFGHLREMYIYSAGPRAVAHLQGLQAPLAATYRGFQMMQAAPRFVLEVALVGVLLAVVYWKSRIGLAPTLVVSIGVFGVAGFRLLLGINRVVGCVQAMRFARPTIERITVALAIPAAPMVAVPAREVGRGGSLRLVNVGYAYTPDKPVLQGVDFELPRRALVAIRGRSGAGKSTLLEIMAGLRTPTAGSVEIDGLRIAHKQELTERIAYAGQQPAVFPDSIRANVAFGRVPQSIRDDDVWRALARAHLDVVRSLPGRLDFRLGSAAGLSGADPAPRPGARAVRGPRLPVAGRADGGAESGNLGSDTKPCASWRPPRAWSSFRIGPRRSRPPTPCGRSAEGRFVSPSPARG